MATVIWSVGALEEVALIRFYIAQFDADAAETVSQRLISTGNSLSDFPRKGRILRGDVRRISLIWPYVLDYEVHGERVDILRVRHGARSDA